jgi:DNA-binding SARP family transcriptional activator
MASGQLRLLFARLALAGATGVSREDLVAALWPTEPPRDAQAILRTLLSRLRSQLGAETVTGRQLVRLVLPEPVTVDAQVAEEAVGRACAALEERDFLAAYRWAQSALHDLSGELLPGERADWVARRRRALEAARLQALEYETLAGSCLGGAQRARAVQAGRELIEQAPFRETGYAALMRAHAACGNAAEAIRVYAGLQKRLREELGSAPSSELVALHERLLAGRRTGPAQPVLYEGSAALLDRTLDAVQRSEPGDASLRCELVLELGRSLEREGQTEQARRAFADAAGMARELGRGDLMGAAALGYGGRGIPFAPGIQDEPLVALLEEALGSLGAAQAPLRARLLARLATGLTAAVDLERRAALIEEAVALARELGDPGCLAFTLSARHLARWGPGNLPQRLADAVEVIRLADLSHDLEAALPGHLWLATDYLEAGDLVAADQALDGYARLAEQLGHPGYLWWEALLRAMRHFMAGRFMDAERSAQRVMALAPRAQDALVAQLVAVQVMSVRKEEGELSGLESAVVQTIKANPDVAAWRCFLAYLYAEAGRLEDARREFELLEADLEALPLDYLWMISIALLADVCAVLDDACAGARLYELLFPHQGHNVVGLGGLWFGPVDHHLALLARTRRDFEAAGRHFEAACDTGRVMGARPWLGHTQREWAAALVLRGAPGDRERAESLLGEAAEIAAELEMVDLDRAVRRVRAGLA